MCLLPVFFVVSDLRGGACRGHSSFGKGRVSFSQSANFPTLNGMLFYSFFHVFVIYLCTAALPVAGFPRKEILWLELR